jgi:hypothetical protein
MFGLSTGIINSFAPFDKFGDVLEDSGYAPIYSET